MVIARDDVKIAPKAAGEWDKHVKCNNTFCTSCIHFFYDRTKNEKKNNDKQQFSPVRRV
jgi:hypothetical protein